MRASIRRLAVLLEGAQHGVASGWLKQTKRVR